MGIFFLDFRLATEFDSAVVAFDASSSNTLCTIWEEWNSLYEKFFQLCLNDL